ncbi:MAG: TetR family transcriptional regulator [Planctomycetes bacterium]|nr:TetR family transcriptional regulator [Planctomycetota bacterium]
MSFRQQKALALRRTLQATALDLFEKHGYENVTVRQIAQGAGVSESSVYRHFQSKQQLILWDEIDSVIERGLVGNLGQGAPFDMLQKVFVEAYSDLSPDALQSLARRAKLIDSIPEVFGAMAQGLEADRKELQAALVAAYERPPLEMQWVARIALTALIAGLENWLEVETETPLQDCIDAAFRAARTALQ